MEHGSDRLFVIFEGKCVGEKRGSAKVLEKCLDVKYTSSKHHLVCLSILSVLRDTDRTGKCRERGMSVGPGCEEQTEAAQDLHVVAEGICEA